MVAIYVIGGLVFLAELLDSCGTIMRRQIASGFQHLGDGSVKGGLRPKSIILLIYYIVCVVRVCWYAL